MGLKSTTMLNGRRLVHKFKDCTRLLLAIASIFLVAVTIELLFTAIKLILGFV